MNHPAIAHTPVLEARSLVVRAGARTLLDGISGRLEAGRFTALLGPNGAGKTTLIRCLSGERRPDEGEVRVRGDPVSSLTPDALARLRAVLPQESDLRFHFTVRDVVLLGRMPHSRDGETRRDRTVAERALASVDMAAFADEDYMHLSGGEKQRVQLARVLAQVWSDDHDSTGRILFLDEPTASLDPEHQLTALQAAREFADCGGAVCAVLHDFNQAMTCADEVWILRDGRKEEAGPPEAVLTSAVIRRVFRVDAVAVEHPGNGRRSILLAGLDPTKSSE